MDWVGMVETIYDLETPSHDDWLTKLAARLGPAMVPRGRGRTIGSIFHVSGDRLVVRGAGQHAVDRDYLERSVRVFQENSELLVKCYRDGHAAASMSSNCGNADFRRSTFAKWFHPIGQHDAFGLLARDGGPWGVSFATGLSKITSIPAVRARPWEKIAAHIHSAMRLRFRVHGAPALPDANPNGALLEIGVDAVLTPDGKVEHAEGQARDYVDSLRHAAVSIDRARGRMRRRDPDGALEAWRSLIEGEWSLVEVFESDGRRFMVARRNAPDAPRTPLLDDRERTVLGLRARAHGVKLIAYELGVSPSSVSRALSTASNKLGLQSMADILRFVGSSRTN
jgi:DNA-binding CsgD family transcriptional regulator